MTYFIYSLNVTVDNFTVSTEYTIMTEWTNEQLPQQFADGPLTFGHFYWLSNKNFKLSGGRFDSFQKYYGISIWECDSTETECATVQDRKTFIQKTRITVFVKDFFFDYKNLNNPVQHFYDSSNTYYFSYTSTLGLDITIQANSYELKNDYKNSYNSESDIFYSLESCRSYSFNFEGVLGYITFSLSSKKNEYSRQVYNIFDLFGQVGGIYEFTQFLPAIFMAMFSSSLLKVSFIKSKWDSSQEELNQNVFNEPNKIREIISNNHESRPLNPILESKISKIEQEINSKHLKQELRSTIKSNICRVLGYCFFWPCQPFFNF